MKKISDIVKRVQAVSVWGESNIEITSIDFDSRKVDRGSLFVAVKGTQSDGHQFINISIEKGAVAIICETMPAQREDFICYIQVEDSSKALAQVACEYYDNPSTKLKLIGITGTNGKTTIATLLYRLFMKLGYLTGLLSTVENFVGNRSLSASHTTPDAVQINKLLAEMVEAGCEFCFMEVSSHAIDQNRIEGLNFVGGVFTNLTHEHLDYHLTFKDYIDTKKKFFDHLPKTSFALTNGDDKNGRVMFQNCGATKKYYALKSMADYKCKVLEQHFDGMLLQLDGVEVWTHFMGQFNAYNLLAVFAVALELGADKLEALEVISHLKPVNGRFESIQSNSGILAIVDYAHTPDALKNVLETIGQIRQANDKVITVVGAGGNRDRSKRPEMGKIVAELSDRVIFTSDNPRYEEPEQIIEEIIAGVTAGNLSKIITIPDRKEAIKTACLLARTGDIVLVAGKGHETYQETNGVRTHFDDKEVIKAIFLQIINPN
ncbi:MAG: UDP-N-acetylmuramoyl-L-alanyl-D-glutamate--2,6-diaminopimelate ligase [Bacteroidales bacterium]|nr:UDP-N-acetylmuramoyl-L-alanyl-D-glutamate--2,6-diaminopimelate ligase [Bacteroidales bacterium]MCF8454330.1 UDP-N-acetylmuramoyl-L-alanyl-D-glutamate--2,6-diaminopimelate ligase [Bacteroidales bacterium]